MRGHQVTKIVKEIKFDGVLGMFDGVLGMLEEKNCFHAQSLKKYLSLTLVFM